MSEANPTRPSVAWRIGLLTPLAVALVLVAISWQQTDLNARLRWMTLGNLFVAVGIAAQGLYWIVARKSLAIGLGALMVGCVVFGFGLHTVLRVFGL